MKIAMECAEVAGVVAVLGADARLVERLAPVDEDQAKSRRKIYRIAGMPDKARHGRK